MMRTAIRVIFMALIMFQIAFAEGTLRGTITDSKTGDPLIGAEVVLKGTTTGSATDADGNFLVSNLANGTYSVVFSYIGYAEVTRSVTIRDGQTETVTVALNPTGIELNPVTVSASRRPEKALDTPASVAVVSAEEVSERPALTPIEHLKAVPGVDVNMNGIMQANVVVRGFNNIFSGGLLSLVDNRIARIPSLRVNAYQMISTPNEDVERVEVVLGPGSALYGPNAASGVYHMITKSPLDDPGTTVSVGGGERSLFLGSFRTAHALSDKVGLKITGNFYQGEDFISRDPVEETARAAAIEANGGDSSDVRIGLRDFDVEKIAFDGRLDFRVTEDATLILNGGYNKASNIELTGLGAGQAIDWIYTFAQARFLYKNLFVQGFMNASDAGDTYLLRDGSAIVDKSKFFVTQAQMSNEIGQKLFVTYGFDGLFTRPDTDGTINGANEDDDSVNELGGYLQADYQVNEQLKLVGAARIDDHSRLPDPIFSPRAALVFHATPTQTFRATFNRAFSTPSSNNLFLDLTSINDVFGLSAFNTALGFDASTQLRAQGVPGSGFNFSRGANGLPQYRTPFAPLVGMGQNAYFDLNGDLGATAMWNAGAAAVNSQLVPQLQALLASFGFDEPTIAALTTQFVGLTPTSVSGVNTNMAALNTTTGSFDPVADVTDVAPMKETTTTTYELGYKGILNSKLVFAADVYYSKKQDFVGPLITETPNVFLDQTTLFANLFAQYTEILARPENAGSITPLLVGGLDTNPAFGGNNNGTAADELAAIYASGAAGIPLGTVSPEEATNPTALILTYRNFGDIDYYGADIAFTYFANEFISFGGSYSHLSDDFFPQDADQAHDIAVNAPKHKASASVNYHNRPAGFAAGLRWRWNDAFPVETGVFNGNVGAYNVVDLNAKYDLPFSSNTSASFTIQNMFNHKHLEMIGAPEIGRLAIIRLTQSF